MARRISSAAESVMCRPHLWIGCLLLVPTHAIGQELAIDHLWIRVSRGAPEARALETAGFQFQRFEQATSLAPTVRSDSRQIRHQGQGTSSMIVRFDNVYLELIWVDDRELLERTAPEHGYTLLHPETSPIGIGLRYLNEDGSTLPFEASSHWAPWMRPTAALATARRDPGALGEPAIFVIPRYLRWDLRTAADPTLLAAAQHQLGVRQVTSIRVFGRGLASASAAVAFLEDRALVEFVESAEALLELEFDGGRASRLDLRPQLPLVIYY